MRQKVAGNRQRQEHLSGTIFVPSVLVKPRRVAFLFVLSLTPQNPQQWGLCAHALPTVASVCTSAPDLWLSEAPRLWVDSDCACAPAGLTSEEQCGPYLRMRSSLVPTEVSVQALRRWCLRMRPLHPLQHGSVLSLIAWPGLRQIDVPF